MFLDDTIEKSNKDKTSRTRDGYAAKTVGQGTKEELTKRNANHEQRQGQLPFGHRGYELSRHGRYSGKVQVGGDRDEGKKPCNSCED